MPSVIEGLPSFNHPEIEKLYQNGLRIETSELEVILSLPKPTLVQDLEAVLIDTTQRTSYYENLFNEELEEGFQDAGLHAIMLLGEVQSKSSLPAILDWLSGTEEFLDFWLGDHLTETVWEAIYKLLPNDWELLEAFLKKPEINMYARSAVTQALTELTLRQTEHRPTVISLYERLLTHYRLHPSVAAKDEFLSMLISELFEIQAKELIPLITTLHDTVQLDIMMAGRKADIVKDMEQGQLTKRELLPITERYQEIVTTWASYTEADEPEELDEMTEEDTDDWEPVERPAVQEFVPVRTEPKIGRNDPCPCGSGKKYKKCCMNN